MTNSLTMSNTLKQSPWKACILSILADKDLHSYPLSLTFDLEIKTNSSNLQKQQFTGMESKKWQ